MLTPPATHTRKYKAWKATRVVTPRTPTEKPEPEPPRVINPHWSPAQFDYMYSVFRAAMQELGQPVPSRTEFKMATPYLFDLRFPTFDARKRVALAIQKYIELMELDID